jgi:hypothetical protein
VLPPPYQLAESYDVLESAGKKWDLEEDKKKQKYPEVG